MGARSSSSSPARIPALGVRALSLVFLSILLMYLDHRDNHLDAVRKTIGAAMYPVRLVVDAPVRFWEWMDDARTNRGELQRELSRAEAERLLTHARLQRLTALEAENARLRALLEARERVRDEIRVAEILSVDANPYEHDLVIGVGSRDGV